MVYLQFICLGGRIHLLYLDHPIFQLITLSSTAINDHFLQFQLWYDFIDSSVT